MFSKLQRDAAHIDMGLSNLRAKMPAVMTGYTYHNPDAGPVLDARQDAARKQRDEMRRFLADYDRMDELVADVQCSNDEIEQELTALAAQTGLEACMEASEVVEEEEEEEGACDRDVASADEAEDDQSASNTDGSAARDSPMIVIARSRASMKSGMALETPALARQSRIARPSASRDRAQQSGNVLETPARQATIAKPSAPKQLHFGDSEDGRL